MNDEFWKKAVMSKLRRTSTSVGFVVRDRRFRSFPEAEAYAQESGLHFVRKGDVGMSRMSELSIVDERLAAVLSSGDEQQVRRLCARCRQSLRCRDLIGDGDDDAAVLAVLQNRDGEHYLEVLNVLYQEKTV